MFKMKHAVLRMLPPTIAGQLQTWHAARLVKHYEPRIVERRCGSRTLKIYLADPLAEKWYDHDGDGNFPELVMLRQHRLRPGARVFNGGAHQAVIAMILAHEVGPSGQVVAVEANPHNFDVAVRNRALNDMRQLELIHAAVTDRVGPVTFNRRL